MLFSISTDLIDREGHIDPHEFFEENYFTDGMKRLPREAFRRFEGQSVQGVFVLSQAMGGGKTHNMIALGLLAKYPELRCTVMDDIYKVSEALEKVRVVAFTGRESDAPFGIWGAIAEQLGKKGAFKDYYSPLAAPGQTAWINLLKGEPLLILLDEFPPYLENARSRPIGLVYSLIGHWIGYSPHRRCPDACTRDFHRGPLARSSQSD